MIAKPGFPYRPEIDGLRALAVIPVVLFHLSLGCAGGFVGVDVFFVISGYLITGLIWKDLETGDFSFADFWMRRIRRIAPALLSMLLFTLLLGFLILLPRNLASLGKSAAMSVVGAGNIYLWYVSDYFGASSEYIPLLHMWSLGVEEQFYLVLPSLLWLLFQFRLTRQRSIVVVILGVVGVISFLTCLSWIRPFPKSAFFLLPSRAWEMLIGSLVALLPMPVALSRFRWAREFLSILGLLLILGPVLNYSAEVSFPGWNAMVPCLGAALIIWSTQSLTIVGSLLSLKHMTLIGKMSYSLYLWHWPLIAYVNYYTFGELFLPQKLTLLAASVIVSALSWRFVETPFRTRATGGVRWALLSQAGAGAGAVVACGLMFVFQQGYPFRFSPGILELANSYKDRYDFRETDVQDVLSGRLNRVGVNSAGRTRAVLVWGDSHAAAASPALSEIFCEHGVEAHLAYRRGVPPVVGWENVVYPKEHVLEYNEQVLKFAERNSFSHVFLIARWLDYMSPESDPHQTFKQSLLETVRRLRRARCEVFVMMPVPEHAVEVPHFLAISELGNYSNSVNTVLTRKCLETEPAVGWINALESAGAIVMNPRDDFLSADGKRYVVQKDGVVLYFDDDHLTVAGAKAILTPFFRRVLKPDCFFNESFSLERAKRAIAIDHSADRR